MREIVLDTETTGLDPGAGHRVVEVGCIELVNMVATGNSLQLYLNPEMPMPTAAQEVHGLTDAFLADKPKFAEVVDEVLAFVAGGEIIIHNAPFDLGFLDEELRRVGRPVFRSHVAQITDSLVMAREMFPGKANSLDALCRRLEVDNSGRTFHGALLDSELLADVYINMTRGQGSLVIDAADEGGGAGLLEVAQVDLSQFQLPVLDAEGPEAEAHAAVLAELDKASGGKTVWRQVMA